jgi:hypothetical protein
MTLPHPQAQDLITKCKGATGGKVSLESLRDAIGEAAAAAEQDPLREKLIYTKDELNGLLKDDSLSTEQRVAQADTAINDLADALSEYVDEQEPPL